MKLQFIYILIVFIGLNSCSSRVVYYNDKSGIPLENSINSALSIDEIITPYRDSMKKEMNEVLAISKYNFIPKRPSSNLMNWVSDALYNNIIKKEKLNQPVFSLLNFGSLRSTINKGKVSRGDLFTLMPFDNEVVIVKLNHSLIGEIESYILNSGGEPMSGAVINNGKLEINNFDRDKIEDFYIITSDYLLNGGDRMNFLAKNTEVIYPGILLRDVLIEEAKLQGELIMKNDIRFF